MNKTNKRIVMFLVETIKGSGRFTARVSSPLRVQMARFALGVALVKEPRAIVACALVGAVAFGMAMKPVQMSDVGVADFDMEMGSVFRTANITIRKPTGVTVVPGSAGKLYKKFSAIGYRLEDIRTGAGVPRVFVKAMPNDIRHLRSIDTRKAVFIKMMLPLILRINEELTASRARIEKLTAMLSRGETIASKSASWLDAQYVRYGVKPGQAKSLLLKVDVIPPSLALAQAAEESGWGTSRFAQEGRALFGQRTYKTAAGIKPNAGAQEHTFNVKSFDRLLDGVRSYALNLNSHRAYVHFRQVRSDLRAAFKDMGSFRLVETLGRYSERGDDYIETIKAIVRVNNLRTLDKAKLSQSLDGARKMEDA
ncbi:MAG: hypothetical protein HN658_07145 [Rhodospirillales bacterium]|nr:hypothetical protein [Rhodospirillales bacterium]